MMPMGPSRSTWCVMQDRKSLHILNHRLQVAYLDHLIPIPDQLSSAQAAPILCAVSCYVSPLLCNLTHNLRA